MAGRRALARPATLGKGAAPRSFALEAQLSSQAYARQGERLPGVGGFDLVPHLSSRRAAVFHNPATGQVEVAFRGTKKSSVADLKDDVLIALGGFGESRRLEKAKATVKAAAAEFGVPKGAVGLTGHSLGGRVAQETGQRLGSSAGVVAFAPGSSPADILKVAAGLPTAAGTGAVVQTAFDPVSFSGAVVARRRDAGALRFRAPLGLDPHGLQNFAP